MNEITYKRTGRSVNVYLEGLWVGTIRKGPDGYRYFANGCADGGDPYHTIGEVKKSLEEA